jgi:glycosyltransferase involved in cell wall biosynthesis
MRIGIYDPYLDDLGGGEKYMMSIAECLSQKNDVTVFWDNQKDFDDVKYRFSLKLEKVKLKKNIFSPTVGFVKRALRSRVYDAIIVLSDGSIPFVLSKKLFIHIQQPLARFEARSLKGKIKLSRVSAIYCNSEYTRSFIKNKFRLETNVIYPPVNISTVDVERKNIILTVGRFRIKDVIAGTDDYKKFSIMISAFKNMVDKGLINWKLVIGTSIRDEDRIKIDALKKETNGYPIDLVINLKNDELWKIYSEAKIYWHAAGFGEDLNKHPERAEHFGISTVEAMGAGCVPVVINAGGQKEIVVSGKNGYLWNTLSELEKLTLQLIKDEKVWDNLSENAMNRSTDFNMEKFCKNLNKLIEK